MATIEVNGLTRVFRVHEKEEGMVGSLKSLFIRRYEDKVAVDKATFQIDRGESVGLIGPNGAGKTTMLKMLSGLLFPTVGGARVLGHTPWDRKRAFLRRISLVLGQKNQLSWDLAAADSFLLIKDLYDIDGNAYRRTLGELVELLGVEDQLHVQVRRLSLGERMKMELIAALLHRPEVVFLDEPTIGLDILAQKAIRSFLQHYNKETGSTIILTSHYMADIQALCNRVLVINHGRIILDGPLEKLVQTVRPTKLLRIRLEEAFLGELHLPIGELLEQDQQHMVIRIPSAESGEAMGHLSSLPGLRIVDFTVENEPMEEVVRALYERRDGLAAIDGSGGTKDTGTPRNR